MNNLYSYGVTYALGSRYRALIIFLSSILLDMGLFIFLGDKKLFIHQDYAIFKILISFQIFFFTREIALYFSFLDEVRQRSALDQIYKLSKTNKLIDYTKCINYKRRSLRPKKTKEDVMRHLMDLYIKDSIESWKPLLNDLENIESIKNLDDSIVKFRNKVFINNDDEICNKLGNY